MKSYNVVVKILHARWTEMKIDYGHKIEKLIELKAKVTAIPMRDLSSVDTHIHLIKTYLKRFLDDSMDYEKRLDSLNFSPMVYFLDVDSTQDEILAFNDGIRGMIAVIDTAIEEIEFQEGLNNTNQQLSQSSMEIIEKNQSIKQDDRIFIVHGHDRELMLEVKEFIFRLDLKPIILSEQDDDGQTIIEKFEKETKDTRFAIILATEDDYGYSKKETNEQRKFRARQNVIFELGYFVGKLGRDRTLTILKGDLELPNDIQGVIYKRANEDWKGYLARKLSNLDYQVNPNWWK